LKYLHPQVHAAAHVVPLGFPPVAFVIAGRPAHPSVRISNGKGPPRQSTSRYFLDLTLNRMEPTFVGCTESWPLHFFPFPLHLQLLFLSSHDNHQTLSSISSPPLSSLLRFPFRFFSRPSSASTPSIALVRRLASNFNSQQWVSSRMSSSSSRMSFPVSIRASSAWNSLLPVLPHLQPRTCA
jgi:hypothetical protein